MLECVLGFCGCGSWSLESVFMTLDVQLVVSSHFFSGLYRLKMILIGIFGLLSLLTITSGTTLNLKPHSYCIFRPIIKCIYVA